MMLIVRICVYSLSLLVISSFSWGGDHLKALIVDGQNNHAWKTTTPLLKQYLEQSGRFTVTVATSPPKRHDMSKFTPNFSDFDVVISNYNGDRWSKDTESRFQSFILGGGGFVSVHAADNAFPDWPEYNEMIGLGGWKARNEKSGPYVYIREGKVIRDESAGAGGHHGPQHEYVVTTREKEHPIMKGLPESWKHTKDELYDKLRGPAKNMTILATAYSSPEKKGTGRDEPILMAIQYGQGRVFHTVLGHADYSMNCVGFVTTFVRGAEWAATGKVTIPAPEPFPSTEKSLPFVSQSAENPKNG